MKSRCSGYSSDTEQNNKQKDTDFSVLRKPIHTALTGFLEAKKAFDNGTDEIRRLLSRECGIIYECNVCRNLFRSLTNFISHKRVYCRNSHNNFRSHFNPTGDSFIDQDVSTIIQAEQEYIKTKPAISSSSVSATSIPVNNAIRDTAGPAGNKDLSSIIERLVEREESNRLMKLTDFYEQVSNKLTQDEILKKKHILQLDRVPNSSVAVYQTVKNSDSDNIKTEVNEVNDLLRNDKTTLGPDGKILPATTAETKKKEENVEKVTEEMQSKTAVDNDQSRIACDICNIQFTTEKTLKLHIQTKHIASTYVYQCPSCSLTFLQPSAVIRHLSNDHKKSTRRIRLMRESIHKRRIRADEVQVKGPSRELARLQTEKDKRDADSKAWMDKVDRTSSDTPTCVYCGKSFERKAVLTTHLNSCSAKTKVTLGNGTRKVEGENSNSSDSLLQFEKKFDAENSKDSVESGSKEERRDRRKRRKPPKIYVNDDGKSDVDSDTLNDMFMNLGKDTASLTLNTVSLVDLNGDGDEEKEDKVVKLEPPEIQEEENLEVIVKKEKVEAPLVETVKVKNEPHRRPNANQKQTPCFCKICEKKFDVLSNLRRHISMFHYRSRKFGCKICEYRAYRKYDVINHLNSAHSIVGEKEVVMEFMEVHEDKYDKESVNGDIVLLDDDEQTKPPEVKQEKPEKSEEKRQRRSRRVKVEEVAAKTPILRETKFTRSSLASLNSSKEGDSNTPLKSDTRFINPASISVPTTSGGSRRPVRNRVKPVNKDFLYDLSNLLKKDMTYAEKLQKRRSTYNPAADDTNKPGISSTSTSSNDEADKANADDSPVKGAAYKMAKLLVAQNRAAFGTPPELPSERPLIQSRLLEAIRNDEVQTGTPSTVPVIETADLEQSFNSGYSSLPEDSFLHNFSKRRKFDLSRRSISGESSTIASLLKKVDLNMNGSKIQKVMKNGNEPTPVPNVQCPTEKEFKEYLQSNKLTEPVKKINVLPFVDPPASIPQAGSPPPTPAKRITLLQRLAENKKNKKLQESLLRSALEN